MTINLTATTQERISEHHKQQKSVTRQIAILTDTRNHIHRMLIPRFNTAVPCHILQACGVESEFSESRRGSARHKSLLGIIQFNCTSKWPVTKRNKADRRNKNQGEEEEVNQEEAGKGLLEDVNLHGSACSSLMVQHRDHENLTSLSAAYADHVTSSCIYPEDTRADQEYLSSLLPQDTREDKESGTIIGADPKQLTRPQGLDDLLDQEKLACPQGQDAIAHHKKVDYQQRQDAIVHWACHQVQDSFADQVELACPQGHNLIVDQERLAYQQQQCAHVDEEPWACHQAQNVLANHETLACSKGQDQLVNQNQLACPLGQNVPVDHEKSAFPGQDAPVDQEQVACPQEPDALVDQAQVACPQGPDAILNQEHWGCPQEQSSLTDQEQLTCPQGQDALVGQECACYQGQDALVDQEQVACTQREGAREDRENLDNSSPQETCVLSAKRPEQELGDARAVLQQHVVRESIGENFAADQTKSSRRREPLKPNTICQQTWLKIAYAFVLFCIPTCAAGHHVDPQQACRKDQNLVPLRGSLCDCAPGYRYRGDTFANCRRGFTEDSPCFCETCPPGQLLDNNNECVPPDSDKLVSTPTLSFTQDITTKPSLGFRTEPTWNTRAVPGDKKTKSSDTTHMFRLVPEGLIIIALFVVACASLILYKNKRTRKMFGNCNPMNTQFSPLKV